jgi:hypothetical protein
MRLPYKDGKRRDSHEYTAFTFLGFTFRQRRARNKQGQKFSSFLPAISKDALNRINADVRSADCIFVPAAPSKTSHGASIRS